MKLQLNPLVVSVSTPTIFILTLWACSPLFAPLPFPKLWFGIIGCVCAYAAIQIGRKLDRNPLTGFSLAFGKLVPIYFLKGLLIAVVVAVVMIGSQILYSDLALTFQSDNVKGFLIGTLAIVPLALMEELAFRSYAFIKLEKVTGIWKAQIFMAILFALYHVVGGWSISSAFIGPGIWSFAFGLLALQSKGIALPTGFHAGLNLTLAAIGDKDYMPGLWVVDFAKSPTEAMVTSNTNFGLALQVISLVVLIFMTWRYAKNR